MVARRISGRAGKAFGGLEERAYERKMLTEPAVAVRGDESNEIQKEKPSENAGGRKNPK